MFGFSPDRLWFGIGRRTLKARAVATRPAVAVVVPGRNSSVVARGEATLVDGWPKPSVEIAHAPFALPVFAARNAVEMAAFARDVVRRSAPALPPVPMSVRVESLQLLEDWPASAVLGWSTPSGPVALPARWIEDTQRAVVPAGPLRAAGGPRRAAACICIDRSAGPGPAAKRGELLRGTARVRLRSDVATVALDVERITRWRGVQTETMITGAA
jgi:hypothetical protein